MEVLLTSELVAHAGSEGRARTWLRAGAYRPVLRGAYVSDAEDPRDPRVRAVAARRLLPPDAALSHRSVLWVLGEQVLLRGQLHVTVPRGRRLRPRPGLVQHSALLPDDQLVLTRGLLMTSAARAVVDVARTESLEQGVAHGDRALRTGAADVTEVRRLVGEAAALRGVDRARRAAGLLDGRSESWLESVLRVRLVAAGLTGLDVQHDVWTRDGHVGRADLHVDGAWVEFDGREVHQRRELFTAERRRQTRIAEAGYELRRYTADDLVRPPVLLVGEIRRAVVLASTRDRSGTTTGPDTLRPPRLRPLPTLAPRRSA